MKRSIILPVAIMFSVLSVVSCTQALEGEAISGREPAGDGAELNAQEVILSAYIADVEPDTKTTIIFDNGGDSGDWHGYWSAHEHISLFYGPGDNGGSDFTSINTEPVDRTQFSGNIGVITGLVEDADDIKFWGIYPYDQRNTSGGSYVTTVIHDTQVARPNSWADGETPMIGRSDGLAMGFYNLCGYFRFFLEPIENDHIVKITFKSNDNRPIAGEVKVVMENGKPVIDQFIEPKITVSLVPPATETAGFFQETNVTSTHAVADGSSAVWYYLTLPPNVWETTDGGITFTFYTANGKMGTRTFTSRQQIVQSNYSGWSTALNRSDRVTYGEIPPANNQIYYTTTNAQPIAFHPDGVHHTAEDIISNVYDQTNERCVITFRNELTYLDNGAFSNCEYLETIVLPESLATIGYSAFMYCTNLEHVYAGGGQTMGSTITSIDRYAFMGCSALKDVVLPTSLTELGGFAFEACTSLTEITIPESLVMTYQIQRENPFGFCTNLQEFHGKYATQDGRFLADVENHILISTAIGAPSLAEGSTCVLPALGLTDLQDSSMLGLKSSTIDFNGNPVRYLGVACFAYSDLQELYLPPEVEQIDLNAFGDCESLEYVYFTGDELPSSIGQYSNLSFSVGITGTASIVSSSTLSSNEGWQSYISNDRLFVYQDDDEVWLHFVDNSSMDNAFIESLNSKFLGANGNALAMNSYGSMPSGLQFGVRRAVPFPDGISSSNNIHILNFSDFINEVAQSAFAGATTLDYVSLPVQVTTIGASAFEGCTQLKQFPASSPSIITGIGEKAFMNCNAMQVNDPDDELRLYSVTSLGDYAFYNCSSLQNVVLGRISTIPDYAFRGCSILKRFIYDSGASITSVGKEAFSGCNNLEIIMSTEDVFGWGTVSLPDVTTVGDYAFNACSKIKNVDLPEATSLTGGSGKGRQFAACAALESVNLPKVTSIPEYCFTNCKVLTTVVLPATVTTVDLGAFNNCLELVQVGTISNTVNLPNVNSLASSAFLKCSSITDVRLGGVQIIPSGAFKDCTSLEGVLLSSAQNLTTIEAQAFLNCQSLFALRDQVGLNQVKINNVTTIGVQAFENSGIRAFTALNASDIGSSAFKNCTKLESVNIPAATTLHQSLFNGDIALTSVIVPNAITLQGSVFYGCTALSSLSLPAIQFIGDRAFAMTRSLETLDLGVNLQSMGKEVFYDTDAALRNSGKLKIYLRGTDWYNNESNPSSQYNWNIWEAFSYDLETSPNQLFQFKNMYVDADIFDNVCQGYQYSFGTGDYIQPL